MVEVQLLDRSSVLDLVRKELPEPLVERTRKDGTLVLIGGEPGEVVVRVGQRHVSVSIFAVVWNGPHTPVMRSQRLASLRWDRLPAALLSKTLHEMIQAAQQLRRAKYRTCEYCGQTNPPEWMHDAQSCHSCATEHLGVVY